MTDKGKEIQRLIASIEKKKRELDIQYAALRDKPWEGIIDKETYDMNVAERKAYEKESDELIATLIKVIGSSLGEEE